MTAFGQQRSFEMSNIPPAPGPEKSIAGAAAGIPAWRATKALCISRQKNDGPTYQSLAAEEPPDAHPHRRTRMPKGLQRSNREPKKPKQLKKLAPPPSSSTVTQVGTAATVPGKKT
jgi:hypothetical protein